jgi:hypothetical protein
MAVLAVPLFFLEKGNREIGLGAGKGDTRDLKCPTPTAISAISARSRRNPRLSGWQVHRASVPETQGQILRVIFDIS